MPLLRNQRNEVGAALRFGRVRIFSSVAAVLVLATSVAGRLGVGLELAFWLFWVVVART